MRRAISIALISITLSLLAADYYGFAARYNILLDECAIDRFAAAEDSGVEPSAHHHLLHSIREKIKPFELGATLFFLFLLALIRQIVCSDKLHALYSSLYSVAWYAATNCLLECAKELIRDSSCSTHSNSVSGHASFMTFYALTALLWTESVGARRRSVWRSIALYVCLTAVFVCAALTLSSTWHGGFHSARQMMLGALFGATSHLIVAWLLALASSRPMAAAAALVVVLASSLYAATIYTAQRHKPPLSQAELKIVGAIVLLLIIVASKHADSNEKKKSDEPKPKKKKS
jgi:uncharacterized membrane protein